MRRSVLFLPGNSPGMLTNGAIFGADSLILDLEDAVSVSQKDCARYLVREALRALDFGACARMIRINGMNTPFWEKDLEAVIPQQPDVIMVTKVNDAEQIRRAEEKIEQIEARLCIGKSSLRIAPLLETAAGIEHACEIAASSHRVASLYLGAEDLTADLRCRRTRQGNEIYYAREKLVYAARAAGKEVYDTPFTDINDSEGLEEDVRLARSLGFTGKLAVSPRQIACINRVFSPTLEEISYAGDVCRAAKLAQEQGKGAVSLDGKMIDAPIVLRAYQILQEAGKGGGHE